MIINDSLKFAFIHIPKCGGSTVRSYLQKFDDLHGSFRGPSDFHPQLGTFDRGHIPLFVLQSYYPIQFDAIKKYWSFAVIRDPFSRFPSSISQQLRMHGGCRVEDLSRRAFQKAADRVIKFLSKQNGTKAFLPLEYIHFQKQTDYVYVNDERLISRLYTLETIHRLITDFQMKFGSRIHHSNKQGWDDRRSNETLVVRNEYLRFVHKMIKPSLRILRPLIFDSIKKQVKSALFVERDSRYQDLFRSETITSFISYYYAADIALYKRLKSLGGVNDKDTSTA